MFFVNFIIHYYYNITLETMESKIFSGKIVDIISNKIFNGSIVVENGKITKVFADESIKNDNYILSGFVDAHIHIESSLLVPSEFARLASVHGTVATVSDPHEIANVLGSDGVYFMIRNAESTPFKFFFGAPSCVPATTFETSGACITSEDIELLLKDSRIKYLSEMMNYPGVIFGFDDVMKKIKIAKEFNKPIDGHCPGLRGENLRKYIDAGITTDHESFELDEALEKISLGMKILIREGSAAKNFDTLKSLINTHSDMVMFCSDDKHPDDLSEGHINLIVQRAVQEGYDVMKVLRIASLNPILHYNLDVGLIREGDDADFIIVDNLKEFNILETFIKGIKVAENGKTLINKTSIELLNNFNTEVKVENDFKLIPEKNKIMVINAIDGQLITNETIEEAYIKNGNVVSNIEKDILKICVVNRYKNAPPSIAFIKNFGLKKGAIATSISHDSHNIIAIGTSDNAICNAVNSLIYTKGGMTVVNEEQIFSIPLPVAGIMSNEDGYIVAEKYKKINEKAKELGTNLNSPFMTLSFMALLVIPKLKLSDKGLFDGEKFEYTSLFVD